MLYLFGFEAAKDGWYEFRWVDKKTERRRAQLH